MKITSELLDKAEKLQTEALDFIEQLNKKHPESKATFADLMNIYFLIKIIELEEKINKQNIIK